MSVIFTIIINEWKLACRGFWTYLSPAIFLMLSVAMFAVSLDGDLQLIAQIATQILLVCVMLALLLGVTSMFSRDFDDGSLEQLFLLGYMPEIIIFAKMLSYWLVQYPLFVIASIAALFMIDGGNTFGADNQNMAGFILYLALCLAPALFFVISVGGFCASFVAGNNKIAPLLALLAIPLVIPAVIFTNSAINNIKSGNAAAFYQMWYILLGLAIFIAPIAIYLATASLKIALEEE